MSEESFGIRKATGHMCGHYVFPWLTCNTCATPFGILQVLDEKWDYVRGFLVRNKIEPLCNKCMGSGAKIFIECNTCGSRFGFLEPFDGKRAFVCDLLTRNEVTAICIKCDDRSIEEHVKESGHKDYLEYYEKQKREVKEEALREIKERTLRDLGK
jgi:hypothetical protein